MPRKIVSKERKFQVAVVSKSSQCQDFCIGEVDSPP